MKQRANAMFAIKGWDEKPYDEAAELRGEGSSAAGHAKENPMMLEYELG